MRMGFVSLLLTITLVTSCSAGAVPREQEAWLRGTQGPYRGRVIDAQTKKPISGAVVVAAWYVDMPALVQRNQVFFDAVEVLTDTDGYFVVDAPEIERRAPQNTEFPVVTVFKPGYRYYRGWFAPSEAMRQRRTQPLLGTVSLDSIAGKGRRQRQENLGLPPGDVPDSKMPNLIKAYSEELEAMKRERWY